jgi:hypothetical protein
MLFQSWILIIALCLSGRPLAAQTNPDSRQQVDLTPRALRHIQERHWPDSPALGAGKYAPGITVDTLRELIQQTVANGRVRQNTNGRPGQIYEYDFGRPIGTRINGGPATRLRVVVSPRNKVVTAFPF